MQTLVTGGAGFIGSHLVSALLKKGHSVTVLDNLSTGRRENLAGLERAQLMEGDARDFETLARLAEKTDWVFHLAAEVSVLNSIEHPKTTWDVNLGGTYNVLEAARRAKIRRLIFLSSAAVYGENPKPPFKESFTPRPESPYAFSKLAGEELCALYARLYGLETVSLRLFNVFGPRQNPTSQYAGVIPSFARKLLRGEPPVIYGDGRQTRDFVYVDDVVRVLLLAAQSKKVVGRVFNVGFGRRLSVNQLLAEIQKILKTKAQPEFSPRQKGDVLHSGAGLSLARKVLGFSPKADFSKALTETVLWFKNSDVFSK